MPSGSELKYDFTQLDDCAGKMRDTIHTTQLIYTLIKDLRSGADASWSGEAKKAYLERHKAINEKITKLTGEMETNYNKLTDAISRYRTNEETQVRMVSNLSDDDIF